jgi:hypothetical protein
MKKQLLHIDFELDFALIAVSCHLKDYRFAWEANKAMQLNFEKVSPYVLPEQEMEFSQYKLPDDVLGISIIANRSAKGYLMSAKPQVDYWLMIEPFDEEELKNRLTALRSISQVLVAYEEKDPQTKEYFIS